VLKDCFSYIHNVDKKEEREAARKEKENTVREEGRCQKQAEIIYLLTNHAFPPHDIIHRMLQKGWKRRGSE
jgi:hypothetical protein